jgi:adenylate cyclase
VTEPSDLGQPDLAGALGDIEDYLLGEQPTLTRLEVAERSGVPIEVAQELWRLLGFPRQADDVPAFTPNDVDALRLAHDLMELGILSPDRMVALTRTWGRSFARLAEWQVGLLATVTVESGEDPARALPRLADEVLPRVDELQSWVWRRHLASAANRLLSVGTPGSTAEMAIVFVDIVGYTSRSRTLSETELVQWLEAFETEAVRLTVERGGRIIKNIGDEVLLVADEPTTAVEIALELTRRGADEEDPFPQVRAGIAYGEVVNRLGDVFGSVVNIAARLTSVARPGTVLVDEGAYRALADGTHDEDVDESSTAAYSFRRIRRLSVKGYSRLKAWTVRPVSES